MPKLPFTKEDYKKFLDSKLSTKTPLIEKVRQFGARLKPKGLK